MTHTYTHAHARVAHAIAPQDFDQFDSLYGLEKFWAFHFYAGFPKDKAATCKIHPKVGGGGGTGSATHHTICSCSCVQLFPLIPLGRTLVKDWEGWPPPRPGAFALLLLPP